MVSITGTGGRSMGRLLLSLLTRSGLSKKNESYSPIKATVGLLKNTVIGRFMCLKRVKAS